MKIFLNIISSLLLTITISSISNFVNYQSTKENVSFNYLNLKHSSWNVTPMNDDLSVYQMNDTYEAYFLDISNPNKSVFTNLNHKGTFYGFNNHEGVFIDSDSNPGQGWNSDGEAYLLNNQGQFTDLHHKGFAFWKMNDTLGVFDLNDNGIDRGYLLDSQGNLTNLHKDVANFTRMNDTLGTFNVPNYVIPAEPYTYLLNNKGQFTKLNKGVWFSRMNDTLGVAKDSNYDTYFLNNKGQFKSLNKKGNNGMTNTLARLTNNQGVFISDNGEDYLLNDYGQFTDLKINVVNNIEFNNKFVVGVGSIFDNAHLIGTNGSLINLNKICWNFTKLNNSIGIFQDGNLNDWLLLLN